MYNPLFVYSLQVIAYTRQDMDLSFHLFSLHSCNFNSISSMMHFDSFYDIHSTYQCNLEFSYLDPTALCPSNQ